MGNPLFNPDVHVLHRLRAGRAHANALPARRDGRALMRVWTVMDADLLARIGPVHNQSAFLEDRVHDWVLDAQGCLRFFSRVVDTDAEVDVVLDYETIPEMQARRAVARFDPATGRKLR